MDVEFEPQPKPLAVSAEGDGVEAFELFRTVKKLAMRRERENPFGPIGFNEPDRQFKRLVEEASKRRVTDGPLVRLEKQTEPAAKPCDHPAHRLHRW